MDGFEVQGQWWLPDHPEHRITGTLSWDPTSGGTLKLLGQLRPRVVIEHPLPDGQVQRVVKDDQDRSYPLVFGQVEDHPYTLLDAFMSFKRRWSPTESTEHVHVNALVDGAWFDDRTVDVDRASVTVRDLAEWVGTSGLKMAYPRIDDGGTAEYQVSATRVEPITVPYSHASIQLRQWLGASTHGNQSMTLTQDWVLHVDSGTPVPWKSFADIASDFQDLVTIATGRTAEFRTVGLQHPDLMEHALNGSPIADMRRTATLHAQWSNRVDRNREGTKADEPITHGDLYFDFAQMTAEGVGRWLDAAAEYRTELGRVMSTRYNPGYLEDRIMNICAALESFDKHRRTVRRADYVVRVEECVSFAGEPFWDLIGEGPDAWAKRTKKLRNDLAHHDEQFRKQGTVGGHLVSEQLYWLFVLCMLRVAEASDGVFEAIAQHRQWLWLKEKAGAGTSR